ncbi:Glycerol-3-phosphate dehydrogenase (NAD(P)(+)) [Desulfonatronospira thiodismutans ASO3-1]|uniref:Glycerol-3-phosphate dehydrogenase [NAD(P)+] n=1 Tax=Desulfonatronospira thiodismutans ASO3-1 TaxID=555779 RepID=D6SPF2_9BACT|nr:NAD(P)H-dependent glycerol-3-phosphate dehydrogenase [Desulfonatronospira thiodismutans]EFI34628.1 Glycerol-3-phosphate dehydrogenase (NAD(P)(+)) [Desulfonatronospira thiodismutans ASO3-1]
MTRIAVLGGGSWGTTLAGMLSEKGLDVRLWIREKELVDEIRKTGENSLFLPGIKLDSRLNVSQDQFEVMQGADYFLVAIPTQFMRKALEGVKDLFPENPVIICASKGVELATLKPMSAVVQESLQEKKPRYAIISGPSFAGEVSRKLPTAVSLGCRDQELGRRVRDVLSTDFFRVYDNPDYKGVELGGALKNIMAIAAGISDGLEFGHDARAALITRGLVEMARLGVALGGRERTFMGLSGMGDLVLTCTGDLSRNRQVGLKLGRGMTLDEIVEGSRMVAEGVKTTESVWHLARKMRVDMPITEQVYQVLFQGKDPRTGVQDLMTRDLKME